MPRVLTGAVEPFQPPLHVEHQRYLPLMDIALESVGEPTELPDALKELIQTNPHCKSVGPCLLLLVVLSNENDGNSTCRSCEILALRSPKPRSNEGSPPMPQEWPTDAESGSQNRACTGASGSF